MLGRSSRTSTSAADGGQGAAPRRTAERSGASPSSPFRHCWRDGRFRRDAALGARALPSQSTRRVRSYTSDESERAIGEMAASGGMRHLGREPSRRKARVGSGPIRAMKASARYGSIRREAALSRVRQTARPRRFPVFVNAAAWCASLENGMAGFSQRLLAVTGVPMMGRHWCSDRG